MAAMLPFACFTAASAQVAQDDPGIHEHALRNASGMTVRFLDYGAIITSIEVPDRAGHFDNVVLGYGSAAEYRAKNDKNRLRARSSAAMPGGSRGADIQHRRQGIQAQAE